MCNLNYAQIDSRFRACALKDQLSVDSGGILGHLIVTDPGHKVPVHVLVNTFTLSYSGVQKLKEDGNM